MNTNALNLETAIAAIQIVPAHPDDFPMLWPILHHVASTGNSHCLSPTMDYNRALAIWFAAGHHVYKAFERTEHTTAPQIVGTFMLRANFDERGKHIGNASYMVHPDHRGKGIGRAMGLFSLAEAKRLGFTAMQYNSVVSTNTAAISLWQSLGFTIIGTVPLAYRHHELGLVDTHIMHRFL